MRRHLTAALVTISLLFGSSTVAQSAVCASAGPGQLRCTISKPSDCEEIHDYPYARDLFCPGAFAAVQTMVSQVAKTLGVNGPAEGFFYYFQTLADPDSQSTVACMDTKAPYPGGSRWVVGAGLPLCHLDAFVTSAGPDTAKRTGASNPIPERLRTFPSFYSKLYSPETSFPLTNFRTGSVFDPIVEGLGSAAHDGFIADYKFFSPTTLYDPAHFLKDSRYHGISGGGGGGWGGEIAILGKHRPVTLLAFGGGGGGGMTSQHPTGAPSPTSALGAGGGGGMQFADGYQDQKKSYNGLGLGAGTGSNESSVQYSYNDYLGSKNPRLPVHQYNPLVIAEYKAQLKNLAQQLTARYKDGKTVVLRGGGGMGAGAEYLDANGQEFEPHALSTQAGFQFSYEFVRGQSNEANGPGKVLDSQNAEQEDLYAFIGDAYLQATKQAYNDCGRDYSNYTCMCPRTHAVVICLVTQHIGDPGKVPSWLQQRHCADDVDTSGQPGNGFSSYQRFLLEATPEADACRDVLRQYFTSQNSPNDRAD